MSGQVDLLLILGGNPVYSAPPELNLRGAIQMAKLRVRLGEHEDETSEVCQWHIPQAHPFEHWSDAPAYDGTVSIIQPLIAPLYGGKSVHEMLAAFTETPEKSSFESGSRLLARRSIRAPISKRGGGIRCTTDSSRIRRCRR